MAGAAGDYSSGDCRVARGVRTYPVAPGEIRRGGRRGCPEGAGSGVGGKAGPGKSMDGGRDPEHTRDSFFPRILKKLTTLKVIYLVRFLYV